MSTPDDPKSGSWRSRPLESEGSGRVSAEPAPSARIERAPTPDEIRATVRRLRGGARLHAVLASLFAVGSVVAYLDRPTRRAGPFEVSETFIQWEVVVLAAGLTLVNFFLALAKSRRAARLAVDPDADHPEAKVFE